MDFLARVAESRILEAIELGEFDDLPGKGKPLELEDLSRVPPHLRAGYKLLRNADALPPELELRRQGYALDRAIMRTTDPAEREELRRLKRENELRYSLLVERGRRRT
ncbi:MAG TPA: DnaJ family domain-containing protein [Solirubrobacterales bacterium]|jgi:hypothetical protein